MILARRLVRFGSRYRPRPVVWTIVGTGKFLSCWVLVVSEWTGFHRSVRYNSMSLLSSSTIKMRPDRSIPIPTGTCHSFPWCWSNIFHQIVQLKPETPRRCITSCAIQAQSSCSEDADYLWRELCQKMTPSMFSSGRNPPPTWSTLHRSSRLPASRFSVIKRRPNHSYQIFDGVVFPSNTMYP